MLCGLFWLYETCEKYRLYTEKFTFIFFYSKPFYYPIFLCLAVSYHHSSIIFNTTPYWSGHLHVIKLTSHSEYHTKVKSTLMASHTTETRLLDIAIKLIIWNHTTILLDFSLTVKAAPHECVIKNSQPLA